MLLCHWDVLRSVVGVFSLGCILLKIIEGPMLSVITLMHFV